MTSPQFRAGQIIPLRYKSRELKTLIIDPNGLGEGRPLAGHPRVWVETNALYWVGQNTLTASVDGGGYERHAACELAGGCTSC